MCVLHYINTHIHSMYISGYVYMILYFYSSGRRYHFFYNVFQTCRDMCMSGMCYVTCTGIVPYVFHVKRYVCHWVTCFT